MASEIFGDDLAESKTFGRRKVTPRACVADSKKHLRAFLTDVLEDLGFVTSECAKADELGMILETQLPDLIVLGLSVDGIEAGKILEILVRRKFGGKVAREKHRHPQRDRVRQARATQGPRPRLAAVERARDAEVG